MPPPFSLLQNFPWTTIILTLWSWPLNFTSFWKFLTFAKHLKRRDDTSYYTLLAKYADFESDEARNKKQHCTLENLNNVTTITTQKTKTMISMVSLKTDCMHV